MEKINLFLAGSPVEVVSGLACIAELQPENPVFFIERNISLNRHAIDILVKAAASRFPQVSFEFFTLERAGLGLQTNGTWTRQSRLLWVRQIKASIDQATRKSFGMSLSQFGEHVEMVHFTALSDYVRILLEACAACPRALYPHGFDNPRLQQIQDTPFLYQPRGVLTALGSLRKMKATAGLGEILVSTLSRLFGRSATCVPYVGTDFVYTFRSSTPQIPNQLVRLTQLRSTFEWLTEITPWKEGLEQAKQVISSNSVVLLISEYSRNPIWEENRHWANAHLLIARATLERTRSKSLVLKAHPRSDGSAASRLAQILREELPDVQIHLLPSDLSMLPIEALALSLEFSAACSIGSCSLPSDIGIDVPHYASPEAGKLFDEGWVGSPFWAKYHDVTKMLISEGVCLDVDSHVRS
jgi:hypothetical protein